MSSEIRTLIDKLNPICKRALETGAALCVAQTHYNVEVEQLLLALYENDTLRTVIHESCPSLAKIPRESLRETLPELIRESAEETAAPAPGGEGFSAAAEKDVPTTALDKYTLDLTAEARAGKIDPIRGRDSAIRQVIDILTR